MNKSVLRRTRRWQSDCYVVEGSIVGNVMEDAFGRGWWAYACVLDWQDKSLGLHATESKAHHAVEQWYKEHA
jgi:hypothetical protein